MVFGVPEARRLIVFPDDKTRQPWNLLSPLAHPAPVITQFCSLPAASIHTCRSTFVYFVRAFYIVTHIFIFFLRDELN
jgi:hypothetical protein